MTSEQGSDLLSVVAGGPPNRGGTATTDNHQAQRVAGGCPSITHPQTRHGEQTIQSTLLPGLFNIDWWESSGIIEWGDQADDIFDEIGRCQYQAGTCNRPVPCNLGDGQIFVHERGMGSGRSTRFEVRLEWRGVTIGLSQRKDASRNLPNFYLKVPGEACLVVGADVACETVERLVNEWGGVLLDEWLRRLDLCFDLPGTDLHQSIFPACDRSQYLSTMRRNCMYRENDRATGFTIGSANVASMTIYDKLAEVIKKNNGIYAAAMKQHRWNGEIPDAAGRIEYRLHREFFRQFDGMKTATDVVSRFPDVMERLVQTEHRPFFQLTDAVPDRKSRHQNRVGVHPAWAEFVELARTLVGQPRRQLVRLDRNLIDAKRALANVVGYLTSAAAQLEITVEGKADLVNCLTTLLDRSELSDEIVKQKFEDKAKRYGTLTGLTEFPLGVNQAV